MKNILTKQFLLFICMLCSFYVNYAATIISNTAGGNWSAATTWAGGALPAAGDDVIIANGAIVTVNFSPGVNFNSITVGQGASGILQFAAGTTAYTLSTSGNFIISSGATVQSNTVSPISATIHTINIGGSFSNAGSFNALASINSKINLAFTGTGSFTNAGSSLTNIFTITMNGGSTANTLDFNPVSALTLPSTGFLSIATGTFKLNGSLPISNPVFNSPTYAIPINSCFWLNNAAATVTGQASSTGSVNGAIRISNGTWNIGTTTNNGMTWSANAVIIIEGGAINVQGKIGVSAASNNITYTQSGGTVTTSISGGSNLLALASFDIGTSAGTSFTMSGGSIILTKAGSNTEYRGPAAGATINITGGNLQIGSNATAASAVFKIAGGAPNIILDNSSGLNPGITQSAAVGVWGDIILNGSGIYTKGSFPLTMQGCSAGNPGNITINGTNTLTLNTSPLVTHALSFTSNWGNQSIELGSGNISGNLLSSLTINNTFSGGTVTLENSYFN